MVNIYQIDRQKYPLEYNQAGLAAVAKIITKRVDARAIFASGNELLELVKASGGYIRQLMQLMQRACLTASGRNHDRIQAEDVEYAIKQLQFRFERSTPKKYFAELAKALLNPSMMNDLFYR